MTNAKDDVDELLKSQSDELEDIQTRLSFIEESLRTGAYRRSWLSRFLNHRLVANLSVATLGGLGALVLGVGIFLLIRGVQWRAALSDLRAEPGIQVMTVRSIGPLQKQVIGLRDPLAPNPHKILQRHNIAPGRVDFQLAEYHSLNTPYGRKRQEEQERDLLELRGKVIEVAGTLSEENRKLREDELGRISQILLEMRFPEAMKKLNLQYDDGVWHADGQLLANEYEDFKAIAPKYILNGAVDLDNIGNYTQAKSEALIAGIQSANLLDLDYAGEPAHVPRLARLIREYDALCVKSGTSPGRIKLVLESNDPDGVVEKVHEIADKLTDVALLEQTRIRLIPPLPVKGKEVTDRLTVQISE